MKALFLLFSAVALVSCQSMEGISPEYAMMGEAGATAPQSERLVRKSASLEMKSSQLKETAEKVKATVQARGGSLKSATLSKESYKATISVPPASLEVLMKDLSKLGKVVSQRVTQDDVTDQYKDIEAVIKNQRALRDRLRVLLEQAHNVKDTLAIEKELTRVQTELDKMESRFKRLKSQVVLSTLHFSIDRETVPGPLGVVTQSASWLLKKLYVLN